MTGRESFLAVGVVDVGGIARSADKAGYDVYTVDYFGDLDVRRFARGFLSILDKGGIKSWRNVNLSDELYALAKKMISQHNIDGILLGSGMDDERDLLHSLNDLSPIVGNPPEIMERVRDKTGFFKELERMGVPHPHTHVASSFREGVEASREMGYPLVLKPQAGYGGREVVKLEDEEGLKKFFKRESREWLIQEYVPGVPASLSLLADGSSMRLLTLNEQLLGRREFGQTGGFAYCGNIVPLRLSEDLTRDCREVAEKIAGGFGLKGSNGIDIVLSIRNGGVKVLEVNPRFQGSMECVERNLNINLVEEHVRACNGGGMPASFNMNWGSHYCRAVLYARASSRVPDLTPYEFLRDVPPPGRWIEGGDPLCSVFTSSTDRSRCLFKAQHLAEVIYRQVGFE